MAYVTLIGLSEDAGRLLSDPVRRMTEFPCLTPENDGTSASDSDQRMTELPSLTLVRG